MAQTGGMILSPEKVVENLDNLTSCTINFPSLIHDAVEVGIINGAEKEIILKNYKSLYDKLTTFYLMVSSKGANVLAKLPSLLEDTGNLRAASFLESDKGQVIMLSDDEESSLDEHQRQILDNLDRLCSHTMNPNMVLGYSNGLELICGKEREIIAKRCPLEVDQLAAFYTLVSTKGPQAYEKLIQVLRMTSNYWALEVLEYHDDISEN